MDKITFKNFRKFKESTTFKLNNINLLVGPNNSGKSTLTKGLRLYLNNLLYLRTDSDNIFSYRPFFDFGGNTFDNPHVGTFGRAMTKSSKENYILFSADICGLEIETTVSRYSVHHKDSNGNLIDYFSDTIAPISKIVIYNKSLDVRFTFDFEAERQRVDFNAEGNVDYYTELRSQLNQLKEDKIEFYSDDDKRTRREQLEHSISFGVKDIISWNGIISKEVIDKWLYSGILRNFSYNFFKIDEKELSHNDILRQHLKNEHFAYYALFVVSRTIEDIQTYVKNESKEIIEAHSVTHSLVYNVSDKNDYMAQTISEYKKQNIQDDDPEKKFLRYWMTKFEIAKDFVIEDFGGECFKLELMEDADNPNNTTPLLDKGVGSNQLMILLLRLATIMRCNRGKSIPPIVIIEEPEQNLHPKWQRLLADLFFEVFAYPKKSNKKSWGITFLVETHSEYIIRRVQLLIAEKRYEDEETLLSENPFNIIYCPQDGEPYDMGLDIYGRFANLFDEGFFDVASKDSIAVSKIERSRR